MSTPSTHITNRTLFNCDHLGYKNHINEINLSINEGERLGITGLNGAGKSTLVQLMAGVISPDKGQIFHSADLRISLVTDQPCLYPLLTVSEHLQPITKINRDKIIIACQLQHLLKKPAGQLSKGYKQRLSLALAVSQQPDLLLLDEPSDGIDQSSMSIIEHILDELPKQTAVAICTHQPSLIEKNCHRLLVLDQGKLVYDQPTRDLKPQWVAIFSQPTRVEVLPDLPENASITINTDFKFTISNLNSEQAEKWLNQCVNQQRSLNQFHQLSMHDRIATQMRIQANQSTEPTP
ncbi:MAG: ATP-binding cassette domain-containing protein [bacterium]